LRLPLLDNDGFARTAIRGVLAALFVLFWDRIDFDNRYAVTHFEHFRARVYTHFTTGAEGVVDFRLHETVLSLIL